jgi:hypothetical protein
MVCLLAGVLAMVVASATQAAEPTKIFQLTVKPHENDTPSRKLQIEQFNVCKEELELLTKYFIHGQWDVALMHNTLECSDRVVNAYLQTGPDAAGTLTALEAALEHSAYMEATLQKRLEAGTLRKTEYLRAKAHRLQKEIDLAKFKEKK